MCVRESHCVDLFSLSPCPVLCSASAVFKGITLLCESLSSVGVCGSSTTQDEKKQKLHITNSRFHAAEEVILMTVLYSSGIIQLGHRQIA